MVIAQDLKSCSLGSASSNLAHVVLFGVIMCVRGIAFCSLRAGASTLLCGGEGEAEGVRECFEKTAQRTRVLRMARTRSFL